MGAGNDVADSRQLEFSELSSFLANVRQEERKQIGRELHDEVLQSLCLADLLIGKVSQSTKTSVRPQLERAWGLIKEASTEIREISRRLGTVPPDDRGFAVSLEQFFTHYTARTGVKVEFKGDGMKSPLPREISDTVYRFVREALTNVARHARVTEASVRLTCSAADLHVEVRDKGCGFDPVAVPPSCKGLRDMTKQILQVGGKLTIDSTPGLGTTIVAEFPLLDDGVTTENWQNTFHQNQLPLF